MLKFNKSLFGKVVMYVLIGRETVCQPKSILAVSPG